MESKLSIVLFIKSTKLVKSTTEKFLNATVVLAIISAMHSEEEKLGFSLRLQTALKLAGLDKLPNTKLADRFNLRHPNQSISTQTFHHWLIGRSIPTPDKVETLAKWLNTSVEWLRYGRMVNEGGAESAEELLLLKYFRALPPEKRRALITLLYIRECD